MNKRYLRPVIVFLSLIAAFVCAVAVLRFIYPRKYSDYVSEYAKRYNISENLIYAVIKCESGFEPFSVSGAGAVGLMQITPDTLQWVAMKSGDTGVLASVLYDAKSNIKYGCCIYSLFLSEFGEESVALAAYNAGRGNVLKWLSDSEHSDDGILLKSIPFPETEKYVKKVLTVKRIYELIY